MYSIDFRRLAVRLYNKCHSLRMVCSLISIGKSTLARWISTIHPKRRHSFISKTRQTIERFIENNISVDPFLTQNDLASMVNATFSIRCSAKYVGHVLKRIGFTRKKARKKTVTATQEEDIRIFCDKYRQIYQTHNCVSIDESGFRTDSIRQYGYSKRGTRLYIKTKPKSYKNLSLLMAISNRGDVQHIVHSNPINGSSFYEFLKQSNIPRGSYLIMDNVAFHKMKRVNELVEERSWNVLYAPPYCPDFNPIEMVFGWMKHHFRKRDSKTVSTINSIVETVPKDLMQKCFMHVGKLRA
jgi:transposase